MSVSKRDYISSLQILIVFLIVKGTAKTKLAILPFLYCGEAVKNSCGREKTPRVAWHGEGFSRLSMGHHSNSNTINIHLLHPWKEIQLTLGYCHYCSVTVKGNTIDTR